MDTTNHTPAQFEPEEFDRWAATYDQDVRSDAFPFTGYDALLDEIVRRADARPGRRALDLGTGTGALAARLAQAGCEVDGCDFSAAMLAIARRKYPRLRFVQADLRGEWPPELDGRYHVLVSAYVFHHFPLNEKVRMLRALADERLLPDGQLLIGDIAFADAHAQAAVQAAAGDDWSDEYYWQMDTALPALRAAGFAAEFIPISACAGLVALRLEETAVRSD